jgi:hypothetical protein
MQIVGPYRSDNRDEEEGKRAAETINNPANTKLKARADGRMDNIRIPAINPTMPVAKIRNENSRRITGRSKSRRPPPKQGRLPRREVAAIAGYVFPYSASDLLKKKSGPPPAGPMCLRLFRIESVVLTNPHTRLVVTSILPWTALE